MIEHPESAAGGAATRSGTVCALIGPPGAGKSAFAARLAAGRPAHHLVVLSSDRHRAAASPHRDDADQDVTEAAVAALHAEARRALALGRSVLVDATSARAEHRGQLLRIACEHGARTRAVVVLPRLEVCLARNAWRRGAGASGHARRVPDAVITRMHAEITAAVPGLPSEGWDEVDVLVG